MPNLLWTFIPVLVRVLAYGLMLYALWIFTADPRQDLGRRMWYRIGRRRILRRAADAPARIRLPRVGYRHLQALLAASYLQATDRLVQTFVRVTVVLTIALAISVFWATHSVQLTLVGTGLGLSLPYLVLRYRLYNQRLARANQIHMLVQLLLGTYRVHSHNLYFALRDTAEQLRVQRSPLAKPVVHLLASVQGMSSDDDLLRALETFVSAIHTSLAQQLGAILSTALIQKRPIEAQLQSLDEEITKLQQSLDEEKAERADNVGLGFLPIVAFPAVELFLYWQSGTQFRRLQFSGSGTTYFTLALIGSLVALLIALFTRRPKIDL